MLAFDSTMGSAIPPRPDVIQVVCASGRKGGLCIWPSGTGAFNVVHNLVVQVSPSLGRCIMTRDLGHGGAAQARFYATNSSLPRILINFMWLNGHITAEALQHMTFAGLTESYTADYNSSTYYQCATDFGYGNYVSTAKYGIFLAAPQNATDNNAGTEFTIWFREDIPNSAWKDIPAALLPFLPRNANSDGGRWHNSYSYMNFTTSGYLHQHPEPVFTGDFSSFF